MAGIKTMGYANMIRPLKQHRFIRVITAFILILVMFLSSCTSKADTGGGTPIVSTQGTAEATISPIPTETITPTPTLLTSEATTTSSFGVIVFSMGDGFYNHLFVYNPYSRPLTRLTGSNWDDIDPAVSPDGKQVAFASNKNGQWDIFLLNMTTDESTRITDTKTYDGSPAWSPDGQYLVFQSMNGNNIDLVIQSVVDLESAPIQITEDAGDNFSPAWSPDGQSVAFITNRNGRNELWLFDLKSSENRFKVVAASDRADFFDPAWSPDGTSLAWCKRETGDQIQTAPVDALSSSPQTVGIGCSPTWSPDGKAILANYQQANSQYLVAYNVTDGALLMPMIKMQAQVQSLVWIDSNSAKFLENFVDLQSIPAPNPLYTVVLSLPTSETGRSGVVEMGDLSAPNAYLADSTDESFEALRQDTAEKLGWDFLGTLDDAYMPLTASTYPDIIENWLYTGRAISVSSGALSADWLTVTREEYGGETYWRVWVRCLDQNGSCGTPILASAWDFESRNSGDLQAYQDGGKLTSIPDGYWVDFTEFAARYGWERLPSQNDWVYYFPGTLFNQFVFRQGLSWRQAMLQLYPVDAIDLMDTGE
jgi:TolB protein